MRYVRDLLVITVVCVFFHCCISEEEDDVEIERRLNLLNKPAIKSIVTDNGDIFDCVDLYKQPAFDHPLLKNHTIQVKPTGYPEETLQATGYPVIGLGDGGCPEGTTPIRRITKPEILRMKSVKEGGTHLLTAKNPGFHFAVVKAQPKRYHGGKVKLNVYQPQVGADQFSASQIWVINENQYAPNFVVAGWMVYPKLFGDYKVRLITSWTVEESQKAGCYNTLCPGFVQVSRDIPLGLVLWSSVIGKQQYETEFYIFQDKERSNWWLFIHQIPVGYWPKELFQNLGFASTVHYGGITYSPPGQSSPQMGSGRFPGEKDACYIRQAQIVTEDGNVEYPYDVSKVADQPNCYNIKPINSYLLQAWEYSYRFGGPGGNCGS